jgi:hypothetical protein
MSNTVHIGKEIQRFWQDSGMSKQVFADRLRVHRNTVTKLFEAKSCDTDVLLRACILLEYNFFQLYTEQLDTSMVSEPTKAYGKAAAAPIRVIFEIDPNDSRAESIATNVARAINNRS